MQRGKSSDSNMSILDPAASVPGGHIRLASEIVKYPLLSISG